MRSSLSIDTGFSSFSTTVIAAGGRRPTALAPGEGLFVAEDDVGLTPGSVQRSVILAILLGRLILTEGPGPAETGVLDGVGAGSIDDGTAGLGDWLMPVAEGSLDGSGTTDPSPRLPSSNLTFRGFFALSFVGYPQHATSKENMPLKRPRQCYTINRREVYAPSSTKPKKRRGHPSTSDSAQCHQRGRT